LKLCAWRFASVPCLVHHSDQGVQYAATDYIDLLKLNGIAISMSRRGNPYDNATCESFITSVGPHFSRLWTPTSAIARAFAQHWLQWKGSWDCTIFEQLNPSLARRRVFTSLYIGGNYEACKALRTNSWNIPSG
jgi:hypothetical protein